MKFKDKIKSKFESISSKKYFTIVLILSFIFILLLNIFTPLVSDDLKYSFGIESKLSSLFDILEFQKYHYFNWGGRSIAHTICQIFLMFPKIIFDVFNSLIYVLLTFLIYKHSMPSKENRPSILILINMLIWFFIPMFGQNILWLTGSCNYLWTMTLVLAFLLPYRLKIDDKKLKNNNLINIGMFLLGILAGWTTENVGVSLITILLLFIFYRKHNKNKVSKSQIFGLIGVIIGFILMIGAPGNYVRSDTIVQNSNLIIRYGTNFLKITRTLTDYLIPLIIIFGITLIISSKEKINKVKIQYIYFIASVIGIYCMVISPYFPPRAWFGPIIFMIIAITINIGLLNLDNKMIKNIIYFIITVTMFSFIINYGNVFLKTIDYNNQWNKRINYIEKEKKSGNLNLKLKLLEAKNNHLAAYKLIDLSYDTKEWPNPDFARYFGLKTVRGSNLND